MQYSTTPGTVPQLMLISSSPGIVSTLSSGSICNGVYGGTFNGDVTVSPGQNCIFLSGKITGNVQQSGGNLVLAGVLVGGKVHINGGGTFYIGPSATIDGDLQIQNIPVGAAPNQVCGATVRGNLHVENNGAAVQIGSASPSCAGNMIRGNLEVHNNSGSTSISNNTIGRSLHDENTAGRTQFLDHVEDHRREGNLEIDDNTGSTAIFDNIVGRNLHDENNTGPTQVFNNTVAQYLQCRNDSSITGGGNTAKQKQGQCSSF
jgi:hypothetical protein